MIQVNYNYKQQYNGNRPYADVVLIGTTGSNPTYKSLVDTGADYLQLPDTAAVQAGISLRGGKQISVQGVGGSVTMTLVSGITVKIEGIQVVVDVLFDPNGASKPILGRQALLATTDAGFNTQDWLWV